MSSSPFNKDSIVLQHDVSALHLFRISYTIHLFCYLTVAPQPLIFFFLGSFNEACQAHAPYSCRQMRSQSMNMNSELRAVCEQTVLTWAFLIFLHYLSALYFILLLLCHHNHSPTFITYTTFPHTLSPFLDLVSTIILLPRPSAIKQFTRFLFVADGN
jgi:hypothetical protein